MKIKKKMKKRGKPNIYNLRKQSICIWPHSHISFMHIAQAHSLHKRFITLSKL